MKLATVGKAMAYSLSCMLIPSCNPEDQSALIENQKALAEALAKNIILEKEIAELKAGSQEAQAKIEEAQTKVSQSEALKMPSRAEVEKTLDLEGSKLKMAAREQSPGSEVISFGTWDLNIPSFERPFSCKAKLVLKAAEGSTQTLYWTGTANMKGEWTFMKAENLESEKIMPTVEPPKEPSKSYDGAERIGPGQDPVIVPPNGQKQTKEPELPPVQEKPKPKYDIPLDRPVMGPGSR